MIVKNTFQVRTQSSYLGGVRLLYRGFMIVLSIDNFAKGRYKVTLDNGESLVLYTGELGKLHIKEEAELGEAEYKKIMQEILPKRAKLRGLNLLQKRPYTEHQLRQKYADGGYPQVIADEAIVYLKGLHLIDDYEYARTFMTYKSSQKSVKRMMMDLMQKGISKDVIQSALASLEEDGDLSDERELIVKILEKRHYNPEEATYEEKQKIRAYLYGKGFDMDAIRRLT